MIQSALITGASSGLGAALAQALARPGTRLLLSGRDAARLEAVAARCRTAGAEVDARTISVTEAGGMAAWIQGAGRLDLVVANAGISAGTGRGESETPHHARTIFAVNLDGMLNTALPALQHMRAQAPDARGVRGRIAVVASIAAFVPAPGAPSYCASKAAVDAWAVGTAPTAAARGVVITSICPGYVRTAMTARNRFPMPGLMDADQAAAIILRGIRAGRRRVVFPWWLGALARCTGLLPSAWVGAAMLRAGGKDALPEPG
jgi:short-subunit dehydrogenase